MKTLVLKLMCILALVLCLASGACAQYFWVTFFDYSGQVLSSSAIDGYYGFPVLANSWSAVGIDPMGADHDIYVCPDQTIFYDYESAYIYATSTGGAGVRDFTVTNGFIWGDYPDHFALVGYGTSSPYYLEAKWGLPNLTLGVAHSSSFAPNDVLDASQVYLIEGQPYTAVASRTTGTMDPGLFVFSPDIEGGSRDTAPWSANASSWLETVVFTPTATGWHCIVVTDENGAASSCDVTVAANPANDEWCAATTIASLPYSTSEYTRYATTGATDPITSCGWPSSQQLRSVWFTVTPTHSGQVQADTFTSDYDTVLAVYSGTCAGSYSAIACNDDSGPDHQSKLTWNATAGTKYYIEAMNAGTTYRPDLAGGNLELHVSYVPPANDNCSSAILLTNLDNTQTQTALNGTVEPGEPVPGCVAGIYDTVWYQFVPAQTGVVTLSTAGSDYDTVMGVYTGTCGALTPLACDDDEPGVKTVTSALALNVTAGVTYYVQVGAYSVTGGGSMRLEYHFGPPCTTIAAARCSPPGTRVSLCNETLTGTSGGLPFIQESDRSAGVAIGGSGPYPGSVVTLVGSTLTAGGNLFVGGNAVGVAYPVALNPVGMTNKTVGGPAACNQGGVTGATGVNNFCLLVRTWGKVTSTDPARHYYWIDDGSNLAYNAGHIGLCVSTTGTIPNVGDYRLVTGHPWMGSPAGTPVLLEASGGGPVP